MHFVKPEKIRKPRIILIDFKPEVPSYLSKQGFNVFSASSGYADNPFFMPIHHSEVELVFWNCEIINKPSRTVQDYRPSEPPAYKKIQSYFDRVKVKGGISVILLGENLQDHNEILRLATGSDFILSPRKTSTILPDDPSKTYSKFFKQFVNESSVKFEIMWYDSFVNHDKYFIDEDQNNFAAFSGDLLISPFIYKQKEALLALLQDYLPLSCSDAIFPDQATYKWLNKDDYIVKPISERMNQKQVLAKKYKQRKKEINKILEDLKKKYSYLQQSLISDDSDLFPNEKKLKQQVKNMLEDLGFDVEDVDIKKRKEGKSLLEDLNVIDNEYKALIEVKGTEKGTSSNWIKKDFSANLAVYLTIHDLKASEVPSMVIFNHERRKDPKERHEPFKDDPDLVEYCKKMKITLVPIYELYRLCNAVLFEKYDKTKARESLKVSGLFKYK